MTFAEKFLKLRKQASLSQEEAAEKLGVSRQAISRWEQGTALPDALNIAGICRFFDVSADYLINDSLTEPDSAAAVAEAEADAEFVKPPENSSDTANKSAYFVYVCSLFHVVALIAEIVAVVLSVANGKFSALHMLLFFGGVLISAIGIVFFEIRMHNVPRESRGVFRRKYYRFSIWLFLLMPCIILFFAIFIPIAQSVGGTVTLGTVLFGAVLLYGVLCGVVSFFLRDKCDKNSHGKF